MSRIAAIDWGEKRIGLAMTDIQRRIALPVGVVAGGKQALHNIKASLPLKEVGLILLGQPLELSGRKGPMANQVEIFGKMLEDALGIQVLLVDERLSSKEADMHLKEIHLHGKQRRERLDAVAATLLLQTYLERQDAK